MVRAFAMAAMAALSVSSAQAQATWPDRPIKFIVHVAAGGGFDLMARILADRLSQQLPQPIIVENMGGGGGVVAGRASRPRRARRLHLPVRRPRPRLAAVHAQAAGLRSDQGFRAGVAGHAVPAVAGGQARRAGEEPERADRARQGRARQADVRIERRRRRGAHSGRDVHAHGRHQDDPRAVPRRRAGVGGAARRPDRHAVRRHRAAAGQHRRRPRPRAGRHHQGAHAVAAGHPGDRRDRCRAFSFRCGPGCSRRPRRRSRSSTGSPPRSARRCRTRDQEALRRRQGRGGRIERPTSSTRSSASSSSSTKTSSGARTSSSNRRERQGDASWAPTSFW